MSTDTPTPERVTLTAEERALIATAEVAPNSDDYDGLELIAAIEQIVTAILAAREQALREEIRSLVTASKATVHGRLALADTLTDWLAR